MAQRFFFFGPGPTLVTTRSSHDYLDGNTQQRHSGGGAASQAHGPPVLPRSHPQATGAMGAQPSPSIRDGNGYIPVGYWPPIPIPVRTKFYPSGYPYPYTGRKMLPYPYPAGNLYPTGNPYPKSIPENYI